MQTHSKQKVAVITGGLSGIGLSSAHLLVMKGWRVVQADIRADLVPPEITDATNMFAYKTDITDIQSIKMLFQFVENNFGRLDFLMTCAGVHSGKSIEQTTEEDYHKMLDVNAHGTFMCIREASKLLKATVGSSILTISSDNGLDGDADAPLYCATKHFIVGLTKSLTLNYKKSGVRVNCLCPGPVDTPFLRNACGNDENIITTTAQSNPLGRLIEPDEIAQVVALLAENQALNGCIWNMDGGANFNGGNTEPPKVK